MTLSSEDFEDMGPDAASEKFEMFESYRKEVQACFDIAQRLDAQNPTLTGAFTGVPSERIARQLEAYRVDAERLAYVYSRHRTDSNALVELELRILNDDYPTMEEVRAAIDAARKPAEVKP